MFFDNTVQMYSALESLNQSSILNRFFRNYAIVAITRGNTESITFYQRWKGSGVENRNYMVSLALAMEINDVIGRFESNEVPIVPLLPPLSSQKNQFIRIPSHYIVRVPYERKLDNFVLCNVVKDPTLDDFSGFSSKRGLSAIIYKPPENFFLITIPFIVLFFESSKSILEQLVSDYTLQTRINETLHLILKEMFDKANDVKGCINTFLEKSPYRDYLFELHAYTLSEKESSLDLDLDFNDLL